MNYGIRRSFSLFVLTALLRYTRILVMPETAGKFILENVSCSKAFRALKLLEFDVIS
jgi:hypothetical protein